jgi:hypothetical protein
VAAGGHNDGVLGVDPLAGAGQPTGAGFDVVLVLHVACAFVALVSVSLSGVESARLLAIRPGLRPPDDLVRYYAPGTNWPGRALHGVPVFGFALLGLSRHAYVLGDGWVTAGLVLWVLAAALAEMVLWPSERRVQELLSRGVGVPEPGPGPAAGSGPDVGADVGAEGGKDGWGRPCRSVAGASAAIVALMVVATVVMFVQP